MLNVETVPVRTISGRADASYAGAVPSGVS